MRAELYVRNDMRAAPTKGPCALCGSTKKAGERRSIGAGKRARRALPWIMI